MALTPASVQSTQLTAVALDPLGAGFTGTGIGMRKKTVMTDEPVSVEMNSNNPWQDASKISIPVECLQNDFATLLTFHGYAEAGCQGYVRTANGMYLGFTGATLDVGTALGLEWEYTFNLNDDRTTKINLMTTLSREEADATLYSTVDPVGVTWTSGEDGTLRLRPGIKKVTVAGTHMGELKECSGSVKSISAPGRLGRPLCIGVGANINTVGRQMAAADIAAVKAATSTNDTIIYEFWSGETIKLTGLFGGKLAKINPAFDGTWELQVQADYPDSAATVIINTTPGVLELVYLDNAAEA